MSEIALPLEIGDSAAAAPPKRAKERILDIARDLFYHRGIRAVGVDEIVGRAGVTKPSLYRSFPSKDALAADYLRQYDLDFWDRFDRSVAAHPGDPRKQLRHWFSRLAERATAQGYRGCGMTNAAVEYPDADNPARSVSEANKQELRRRLREMAHEMHASEPEKLGDGLLLLMEGAFASGQLFGPGGPAAAVADAADALISAHLAPVVG